MAQRDNAIEEIKRLDALLEYAVEHNDAAEAERLREELRRLTEEESTEPIHDIPAGKAKHR